MLKLQMLWRKIKWDKEDRGGVGGVLYDTE